MVPTDKQLSDVLSEFARTMVTEFPIQGILDRLVERIVGIMPITGAGVTLISYGVPPRYIAASDEPAFRFEELQTELGEGPCLLAYEGGQAVTAPDLRRETRFPTFTPRALDAGLAAVFALPLRHGTRQLGALDLYRDTPGPLSAPTMTAAQTLADVTAAYLLNAQARADLKDSSDRSREAALHDALTGLPNRVLMLERLDHAFLRARRSGKTSAVLFIDLDRFKAVNDTYGHRIGDELLIAVADRLSSTLRPGDTLARLAGDEFVILCEDLETPIQATAIATRMDAALGRPFYLSNVVVNMTASVGIALAARGEHLPEQLLHDADMAMYQAKREGGARHQILDLRARNIADHQTGLERDLHEAIARGELHTDYQPIVATVEGRVTGVEALLRWYHPQRGLVAPSTLIPLAEQSGLIGRIGQWVLAQAWADRLRWPHRHDGDELSVSVNVSAHQLMSAGFAASVATVVAEADTHASLLTLELTESVLVRDPERALVVLKDLKGIGVTLALDDFGTGYSPLSYLNRFPLDIVKIDQTLIAGLGRSSASGVIVGAVIQLAHGLGMTVVAEGVETADQHHGVAELGCDASQGYYYARPMTATNLDTLLHSDENANCPSLPSRIQTDICAPFTW